MARKRIHATGAVFVTDTYGGGATVPPTVVGAPPQWDDNSDSSYAELETFEHPDVSYVDEAVATLDPAGIHVSTNPALVTVKALIRYQCLAVDMGPPTCTVYHSSNTFSLLNGSAPGGTIGSQSPTWIELILSETAPGRLGTFLSRVNDGTGSLDIRVRPQTLQNYSFRYPRTRIYEAYLVIQTAGIAPPCRNIKRGDRLDLGGARNYPPSKMQQTSSRGVGAY